MTVSEPQLFTSAVGEWLGSIRHLALDMDGTIYRGDSLFPFTKRFLAGLDGLGIGYSFLTNNSSKSAADYLSHLRKMGLEASFSQMHTSAHAAFHYLRRERPEIRRLYVLGTPSLKEEARERGFDIAGLHGGEPDAVLAGFDLELGFESLGQAAWWITQGKPFFATHPDRVCPTDQPTVLIDCGAMCAMLREATGRGPERIFGKPEPAMLEALSARHRLPMREIAMVGDRLYTDVAMARRAGALGVLVLSGEATAEEAAASADTPDLVVRDLEELGALLRQTRAVSPS